MVLISLQTPVEQGSTNPCPFNVVRASDFAFVFPTWEEWEGQEHRWLLWCRCAGGWMSGEEKLLCSSPLRVARGIVLPDNGLCPPGHHEWMEASVTVWREDMRKNAELGSPFFHWQQALGSCVSSFPAFISQWPNCFWIFLTLLLRCLVGYRTLFPRLCTSLWLTSFRPCSNAVTLSEAYPDGPIYKDDTPLTPSSPSMLYFSPAACSLD